MSNHEILKIADQAGLTPVVEMFEDEIVKFAMAAVLAEREACAKVCEAHWRFNGSASECADAIRARGEK
jgi:hypothetical protein